MMIRIALHNIASDSPVFLRGPPLRFFLRASRSDIICTARALPTPPQVTAASRIHLIDDDVHIEVEVMALWLPRKMLTNVSKELEVRA